jgi:hypothetical protein
MVSTLLHIVLALMAILITLVIIWTRNNYLADIRAPFVGEIVFTEPMIDVRLVERWSELGPEEGHMSIAGPAILRVPKWVYNFLGKYYLCFSHHRANFIRLAHADMPLECGSIYDPGAYGLAESGLFHLDAAVLPVKDGLKKIWQNFSIYIANIGDVIDKANQRFVMFYHGQRDKLSQVVGIASAVDGVAFGDLTQQIVGAYTHRCAHKYDHYLLGSPGILFHSNRKLMAYYPRDYSFFESNFWHFTLAVRTNNPTMIWSWGGDYHECALRS